MFLFFYITLALLLAYGLLIAYYWRAWNNIPALNTASVLPPQTRVTIIIPARNEEKNIGACLQAVLDQNYPPQLMEIMVMDDHSTDGTVKLVSAFRDDRVHLIRLQDHISDPLNSYKKKAIELAIAHSSGELIITTDADCTMPANWVARLVQARTEQRAEFIAAPVSMWGNASLLSVFQVLDFIALQGITGASVYKKIHTMCNGANMAYTRKAFESVNGFAGIDAIASGDDMLLMYKIDQKYPGQLFFLKSRDAIVSTTVMGNWKDFINQRIRWASKADKYDDRRIFATLLFVYLLNVCVFAFLPSSLWNWRYLLLFVVLITVKTLIEFPFVYSVAQFFGRQKLMWYFFFLQPLHILYTVIAGWLGKFGSYQWKGRVVK